MRMVSFKTYGTALIAVCFAAISSVSTSNAQPDTVKTSMASDAKWRTNLSSSWEKVIGKNFTRKDADAAYDAFNAYFYNPKSGVYQKSIANKQRAAIWVQAIYWDMAMNAWKRTGEYKYRKQIDDIYNGAVSEYDNFNWDNAKEWFIYDDIMWWVISLARAYELTGDQKYLDLSQSGFKRVWDGSPVVGDDGSYDRENGGMRWGWERNQRGGKMACINFPTVIGAMTLYNITGKDEYLTKALEIYNWADSLLVAGGRVADHKNTGRPNWKDHIYNQATYIGAAVMLYKKTGDQRYLDNAIEGADYVRFVMCDEKGIFPYETGIEQGIYVAIFAQYIIRLIEDCGQEQYLEWLRDNINTAWRNRDYARTLTFKNFAIRCPGGDIESYDASGAVALMQVVPTKSFNSK